MADHSRPQLCIRPRIRPVRQACETLPSCLASSSTPTFARITFCSVVIVLVLRFFRAPRTLLRLFAVGPAVTGRPRTEPYERLSRIRLPPWVFDGEAYARPRMKDSRFGEPVVRQPGYPGPRELVPLTAPLKRAP